MAKENHVSLTEAKQHLGELVKRAAYGGERFVLEFREKPQAAIVSYEDLKRLQTEAGSQQDKWAALERLDAIRKQIAARTGTMPDSSEEIARMRDERAMYLAGVDVPDRRKAALARLRQMRESLYEPGPGELTDSGTDIEQLREERLADILGDD